MKKYLILLVCCSMGQAQDEYRRGLELFRAGQYQSAIDVLQEAVIATPDWYYPIYLIGNCHLRMKNYDKAIGYFEDALTLEVGSKDIPGIRFLIAKAHMGAKNYDKAVQTLNDLVGITPRDRHFDIFLNRANCQLQQARDAGNDRKQALAFYQASAKSFSRALAETSDKPRLLQEAAFQRAHVLDKAAGLDGKPAAIDRGIKAYEQALALNSAEKRAHQNVISLQFRKITQTGRDGKVAQYNQAITYLDRYLNHWPEDTEVLEKKGQALQGAKRFAEAIDVFRKVCQVKPEDGRALFSLASCLMADGYYKEALGYFEKAGQLGEKENPSIYSYSAYCLTKQKTGCYRTDIPLYEKAIKVLQNGMAATSGQGRGLLTKDLEGKTNNLTILKENLKTDNQNHIAVLDNIRNLQKTITANLGTLQRNQELYLDQPTPELKFAIDEGKAAIEADKVALTKETRIMESYVVEARKCGGARSFSHFDEMLGTLKQIQVAAR